MHDMSRRSRGTNMLNSRKEADTEYEVREEKRMTAKQKQRETPMQRLMRDQKESVELGMKRKPATPLHIEERGDRNLRSLCMNRHRKASGSKRASGRRPSNLMRTVYLDRSTNEEPSQLADDARAPPHLGTTATTATKWWSDRSDTSSDDSRHDPCDNNDEQYFSDHFIEELRSRTGSVASDFTTPRPQGPTGGKHGR
ncbi:hypothetical protein PMIN03_011732 [Paraphaeosphaeria minitans]